MIFPPKTQILLLIFFLRFVVKLTFSSLHSLNFFLKQIFLIISKRTLLNNNLFGKIKEWMDFVASKQNLSPQIDLDKCRVHIYLKFICKLFSTFAGCSVLLRKKLTTLLAYYCYNLMLFMRTKNYHTFCIFLLHRLKIFIRQGDIPKTTLLLLVPLLHKTRIQESFHMYKAGKVFPRHAEKIM